jgi:hypothetical protein
MICSVCSPACSSFADAIQLHRSSVRFLFTGLYTDAIHSLIQGLDLLKIRLETEDIELSTLHTLSKDENYALDDKAACVIDRKPFDHRCFAGEECLTEASRYPSCPSCQPSLIFAMLYNLALAYHLYAVNNNVETDYIALLQQASRLYREAARRFREQDPVSISPSALERNLFHVQNTILR